MGFAFAGMETFVRKHVPSGSTFTSPYLVATFLFGAWLYLYRGVVPVSVASTMVVLVLCVLALSTSLVRYGFFGGIAYLALFLAYHPKLSVRWFLRLGDYSYGIYVFAFPVQQFLVWWLHVHTPLTLFALAFPATLAMAIVSWHLIERPALALKRSGAFSLPFTEAPETKKARESTASPEG
jgi:peptidoglycan/LPS O-acetylase OafA/YrhL